MRLKRVNNRNETGAIQLPKLPERPQHGHKGTFGRVLVIGGSDGMIGAPVFTGTAALRSGAGLAQIAVPKSVLGAALSITPELIGIDSNITRDVKKACELADAVVIGPGLGNSAIAQTRVKAAMRLSRQVVLDADGLRVLTEAKKWPRTFLAKTVLTPHPGEMARLLSRENIPVDRIGRQSVAVECAKKFGQVVVLKGFETVVTDGERVFLNSTGNTSLAKAGTGDVLSGMIATFMAQGLERFEAACLGVYLHGLAGEIAGAKLGERSVLASDVVSVISDAILNYPAKTGKLY